MNFISLNKIQVNGCKIEYDFQYSDSLKNYFSGNPFVIEYPENMEKIPKGVLAIPFVTNVLPMVWLTDSELSVPELDRDFYESIPEFKKGYIDMYPEAKWLGSIKTGEIIDCTPEHAEGAIAFFSGGLDATTTLLRHYEERPDLLVIWGSDIAFDNQDGWKTMYQGLKETAEDYHLSLGVIHSSFRQFDKEGALTKEYSPILKDGWWHGVKHGIAIIGHAAPMVWANSKKHLYIASSKCIEDRNMRIASYPTIDNNVRFCGCNVIHDGFEYSRQKKAAYVVNYRRRAVQPISLHVCWESSTGTNCCKCEKCYRTMIAIWSEGDEPCYYGFEYDSSTIFDDMYQLLALKYNYGSSDQWNHIKNAMKENWPIIKERPYANKLKWILDFDFDNAESNPCRIAFRKQQKKKLPWKERMSLRFPGLYSIYKKLLKKGN